MRIILIRHGMTEGNKKKRYIGITDEPLCDEGISFFRGKKYPWVQKVYTSHLLRTIQTAEQIYPGIKRETIRDLGESDFGEFENKSYLELSDDPNYQKWIESGGQAPFPGGESIEAVRGRVISGFCKAVSKASEEGYCVIAFVVHGGTIMHIMSAFAQERKAFYEWHVDNGCGYSMDAIFADETSDESSRHIRALCNIENICL
ncbi:MAG: histidine phosphatase family protein [Blautia sp.]|nr:histidine phosphatase family protein [Blautia sp.]